MNDLLLKEIKENTTTNQTSILQISIYVLIGIGLLLCIAGLIWTKLIRPNQFAYSYKNHDFQKKYKNWIQKLNSQSKIIDYQDLMLDFGDQKPILLERMFVSVQNVYLVANPLSKKVLKVVKDSNQIKLRFLKKQLDLPLDLNLLINNKKRLVKATGVSNINLIVPVNNDNFQQITIDQIHFISTNKILEWIENEEAKESQFNAVEFSNLIKSKLIKRKKQRTLKFWKQNNELEN